MKRLMVLMVCALFLFGNAWAKIYKVGSADEMSRAGEKVKPGDEIVIANGSYAAWEIVINTNGTVDKPIKIRAEKTGNVTFSGDVAKPIFQLIGSYTEISGLTFSNCTILKSKDASGLLIELKNAKYCRVTDCVFMKNTVKAQFMPIVVISGNADHNRVDHCTFTMNVDNQELQVKITKDEVPAYTLIDDNLFAQKDSVKWPVYNGGECVQVGQDPILLGNQYAYATVRNNRFINCDGEPEVISNKSSGNKYINNYFENCHGELVMRGGHDCLIDSNTFKGGLGGIRVNGTHHTITNNSFTGLPTAIMLMYGMAKGKSETGFYIAASDCVIKYNSITRSITGILIGDGKNVDWTGRFDTKRYPSRTKQDIPPFDNTLLENTITETMKPIVYNENR